MYWPNGVPRVYAVNEPAVPPKPKPADEDVTREPDSSQEKQRASDDNGGEDPHAEPGPKAESPITGLCVTRNGNMFATMTDSSVAIWQTRVCLLYSLDASVDSPSLLQSLA